MTALARAVTDNEEDASRVRLRWMMEFDKANQQNKQAMQ